jgi:hypothetical protein
VTQDRKAARERGFFPKHLGLSGSFLRFRDSQSVGGGDMHIEGSNGGRILDQRLHDLQHSFVLLTRVALGIISGLL